MMILESGLGGHVELPSLEHVAGRDPHNTPTGSPTGCAPPDIQGARQ